MSINNKKSTLQAFIVAQKVDLACLTEIWIRESESITLNPLTSPSYFVLHQLWTDGWDGSILLRGISLQDAFHVSYSLGPALLFKVIGPEGCITSSLWDSALYYMHPLYPPILQVIQKISLNCTNFILVTLCWPSNTCFPCLLRLSKGLCYSE